MRGERCDDLTAFKVWKFRVCAKAGGLPWKNFDEAPMKELAELEIVRSEMSRILEEKQIMEMQRRQSGQ